MPACRFFYAAAAALITDPAGQVLLVKPNYRDHWTLPGGICEDAEPPHAACAREVREELGLDLPVGRLLVIDWAAPDGKRPNPIMHFAFDGGIDTLAVFAAGRPVTVRPYAGDHDPDAIIAGPCPS